VVVAFVYETGERYGFGVREGDSETVAAINEGLTAVQDDGTYEQLRNKWFGGDGDSEDTGTPTSTATY
jgi:polar amino acid transport system substrate-binding protein